MILRVCGLLTGAFLVPAWAGEYAILASGLRIHTDRHEASGGVIRLFQKDGMTELPAAMVAGFEEDDYVPPSAVSAAPAAAPTPAPTVAPARSDPKTLVRDAAVRSESLDRI